TLLSQVMSSWSGPSACRQALVTSSDTTSRTSSAAARCSAPAAGSQPHAYSAWRVKSLASGTTPLWSSKFSLRDCRPTGRGVAPAEPGGAWDAFAAAGCPDGAARPPSDAFDTRAAPPDAPEAPLGSAPRSPGE